MLVPLMRRLFPSHEPVEIGPYLRLLQRIAASTSDNPCWCIRAAVEFDRLPYEAAKAGLIRKTSKGMWAQYWELTPKGRDNLEAYEAAHISRAEGSIAAVQNSAVIRSA